MNKSIRDAIEEIACDETFEIHTTYLPLAQLKVDGFLYVTEQCVIKYELNEPKKPHTPHNLDSEDHQGTQ